MFFIKYLRANRCQQTFLQRSLISLNVYPIQIRRENSPPRSICVRGISSSCWCRFSSVFNRENASVQSICRSEFGQQACYVGCEVEHQLLIALSFSSCLYQRASGKQRVVVTRNSQPSRWCRANRWTVFQVLCCNRSMLPCIVNPSHRLPMAASGVCF